MSGTKRIWHDNMSSYNPAPNANIYHHHGHAQGGVGDVTDSGGGGFVPSDPMVHSNFHVECPPVAQPLPVHSVPAAYGAHTHLAPYGPAGINKCLPNNITAGLFINNFLVCALVDCLVVNMCVFHMGVE